MSNFKNECLANYAINEKIWQAKESTASDVACAWRKQALLLQHLTGECDDTTHFALMQNHFEKLNKQNDRIENFMKERKANIQRLMGKYNKSVQTQNIIADLKELETETSPDTTAGLAYESYKSMEVQEEHLNIFKSFGHKNSTTNGTEAQSKSPETRPQSSVRKTAGHYEPIGSPTITVTAKRIKPIAISPPSSVDHEERKNCGSADGSGDFRTAREELALQNLQKHNPAKAAASRLNKIQLNYGAIKKSLGTRRCVRSNFVPPIPRPTNDSTVAPAIVSNATKVDNTATVATTSANAPTAGNDEMTSSPSLGNIDAKMIEIIKSEIMHQYKYVDWEDIAGLDYVKSIILEAVVYPLLRPDIFTGLRRPPRGILLFGPPGTGKTLIGKCIASQSKSTFFSISPSTLTSKWVGDGEKLVKALFAVAAEHQPAVVFLDEIDSLLSQRSENEHESSRRLKNEFLIHLDGASTTQDERILIIGATNRPQELDDAARRRFVRRLYIPLPEKEARQQILINLLKTVQNSLTAEQIDEIATLSDGYSGADISSLCSEAAMEPIRDIPRAEIGVFNAKNVRPVCKEDFLAALKIVSPSVSQGDLKQYTEWNKNYGARR